MDGGDHSFHLSDVDIYLVLVKLRPDREGARVLSDHVVTVCAVHKVTPSRAETGVVVQIRVEKNIRALLRGLVLGADRVAPL